MFGMAAPNEHQYFEFHRPIVYSIEGMTKRSLKLYISNITNHLYSKSTCPAANWHSRASNEDKAIMGYSCHLHLQFNYDPLFISELLFMFFLDWPANVILVFHVTIGNLWKLSILLTPYCPVNLLTNQGHVLLKWHNAAISFQPIVEHLSHESCAAIGWKAYNSISETMSRIHFENISLWTL